MKLIICGNGEFFNKLISKYFSDESMNYNFIYIDNLELNIDKDNNEYIDYLKNKYKDNLPEITFYLILFKKALNPINGFEDFKKIFDFPSQFFLIKKESNNNVSLAFIYNNNSQNFLEKNIKLYLLTDITFSKLNFLNNLSFKGILVEELIIQSLEIGKIITNGISEENIITVDEIISISKNEIISNNLNLDFNQPILIKQKDKNGKTIDICLIIGNYIFFIQIGLNKNLGKINKILKVNFVNLLNNISKYINHNLDEYKIIIIFDKNEIEQAYEKFNKKKMKWIYFMKT